MPSNFMKPIPRFVPFATSPKRVLGFVFGIVPAIVCFPQTPAASSADANRTTAGTPVQLPPSIRPSAAWLRQAAEDAKHDRQSIPYDGVSPNKLVCDTTLRELPDGSWALFMLAGDNFEPSPGNYVGVTRSVDLGKTWTPLAPVDIGLPRAGKTIGQGPTELMTIGQRSTLFFSTHSQTWGRDWQSWMIQSDDNCRTWSEPKPMPGRLAGFTFIRNHIVTRDGRIVVPFQHYEGPPAETPPPPPEGKPWHKALFHYVSNPRNGVLISSDAGKTWTEHGNIRLTPNDRYHGWAENNVVELSDGRIAMIIRADALGGKLYKAESFDGGRTWPDYAGITEIPNPGSKATLYGLGGDIVAILHNSNSAHRSPMALWISFDGMKTWPYQRVLQPVSVDGPKGKMNYPDGFVSKDKQWLHFAFDDNRHRAVHYSAKLPPLDSPPVNGATPVSLPLLVPPGWDPKAEADKVLSNLIRVSAAQVRGAHDADLVLVGERAYIVEHDNDIKPGHGAGKDQYCVLTVVNIKTLAVERVVPLAKSAQVFANETLPVGACFVPRILQLNKTTLRCFFACEDQSGRGQAQTWYRDFDLSTFAFSPAIHRMKIKTASGTFDLDPKPFHADAVAHGFRQKFVGFGLYMIDSFKAIDGGTYAVINNWPGAQNALAVLNDGHDTLEILGHYNEPAELRLTESSVNRLPDGTWLAICRAESGDRNYVFTASKDGKTWTQGEPRPFVAKGSNSKPTFDKFNGIYYLGWQEASRIQDGRGVGRKIFNIEISRDGVTWERKYRFESEDSFQYPTFRQHDGAVWFTVTQGARDSTDRIMFGKLE